MCILIAAIAGGVTLREHEPTPPGDVARVSSDGLVLKDSSQSNEISWDRVWAVEGPHQQEAEPFLELSDRLFRARKRVERRDLVLAEPVLEDLARKYRAIGGQTGATLQTLRLACRLMRGGQLAALDAYGQYLTCFSDEQLRSGSARLGGRSMDAMPLSDRPSPILVPDLPPMWLELPALRAVNAAGVEDLKGKPRDLLNLFVIAAEFESGEAVTVPPIDMGEDGELVRDIVLARTGDASQRIKARAALTSRLKPGIENWRESWIRVGIGRSLIREDDEDSKLAGVEQLLHAPAEFAEVTPYLAGIALAESAVVLKGVADPAEADQLVLELRDRFPHHVALEWRPIREWVLAQRKAPQSPEAQQ